MPRGGSRPGSGRPRKGDSKNESAEFTSEQLNELLKSPHIAFVSRRTVSYTAAFKETCWQRYIDGIEPIRIFAEAGLSIDVLGRARIAGFFKTLRQQTAKGLSFNEGNEPHNSQSEQKFDFPIPPKRIYKASKISDADIEKMYHQVAYMSQELEFIKKIILAGKDGKLK
jgi:hypothetical protein